MYVFNSIIEIKFTYYKIYPFKVYDSMVFSMFAELYKLSQSNFRTFLLLQKETLTSFLYPQKYFVIIARNNWKLN